MFVQVTDYHGNKIGIDPSKIIQIPAQRDS